MNRSICFLAPTALLVLALAVGGAGQNFPLLEMMLDLAALATAGVLAWRADPRRLTPLARSAVALMAAMLALPLLQLVPLPPQLWHLLPGREVVAAIDLSLGWSRWRPLSLDPESTARAVLSAVPACVMFYAALRLASADRARLLALIACFALVNALLGIVQLVTGGGMTPYPSSHTGYPIGLFVNRNHSAVLLLAGMPLVAGLAGERMRRTGSRAAHVAGALAILTIMAVLIIATTSRMALLLLPLALAGSLALLFFRQSVWRVAMPSTLVLAAVAATISWVGGFSRNLARFSSLHDGRFDYWDDVSWALHHYGLAGTGFGTFIPVYQTAESLSSVSPQILNHAHNDFIEIVLEGGIPAAVLLILFFALFAAAILRMRGRRLEPGQTATALAALVGILVILAFSLVDYPLRMPALGCVFAVLCACLFPNPVPAAPPTARRPDPEAAPARGMWRNHAARGAVLAGIAAVSAMAVSAGVSEASLLSGNAAAASAWAPWSTAAHESLADDALGASDLGRARREAMATLRLSPIDAVAVRTVAMERAVRGPAGAGQDLMETAVSLGWRDPVTQLWAIGASQQTGEPDKAVERAEALFQQDLFFPSAVELLLRDSPDGPTARSLLRALASSPPWRAQFFKAAAGLAPPALARAAALASRLESTHAPLSAAEAQPLVDRLLASSDIDDARRLWTATRGPNLVANGGFEQLSLRNGADAPSSWDVDDEDLATIAIQHPGFGGDGLALRISAGARSGPILSQRLVLGPGRYVLRFRSQGGPGPAVTLRWTFGCAASVSSPMVADTPAGRRGWRESALQFTVPIQDCPIQRLALARPDVIHSTEVWVDDVRLEPAAPR